MIHSGLPVLVSTSHTVAARWRSYQYPAYGRAGAQEDETNLSFGLSRPEGRGGRPTERRLAKGGLDALNQTRVRCGKSPQGEPFELARQHSVPLLLSSSSGAEPLRPVAQQGGDAVSEAYIQALVHDHPECLPIAEIDAMFSGPVPICTELNTPAGPIDNFMITPSGPTGARRMQALAQSGGAPRGRKPNSRLR